MAHGKESTTARSFWKFLAVTAVLMTAAACTSRLLTEPAAAPHDSEDVIHRVDTEDPVVFLTIDDGATRDPAMIDVLDDADVEATLFLTAQYAKQDADFFVRMRDETGSTIENHTLDHPDLASEPVDEQRRQICETSDTFETLFGRRPTMLRPPYGSFDDDTLSAAVECDATHVVHWSAVIENGDIEFAAGDRLQSGDIVLMHFTEQFEQDVAAFAEHAQKAGLEPALLEDYLT